MMVMNKWLMGAAVLAAGVSPGFGADHDGWQSVSLFSGDRPPAGFLAEAVGERRGIALNAGYGKFGYGAVMLPEPWKAGRYRFRFELSARDAQAVPVAFYALLPDRKHFPLTDVVRSGTPGKRIRVEVAKTVPASFTAILMKKMEDRRDVSLVWCDLSVKAETAAVVRPVAMVPGTSFEFAVPDRVPGGTIVTGEGGRRGVAVPGATGRFGWAALALGRSFPAGEYEFDGEVFAPGRAAPEIALYLIGDDGKQFQVSETLRGSGKRGTASKWPFRALVPFSRLAVKKLGSGGEVSVALGRFSLHLISGRNSRLEAYRRVLDYPAPWGLRSASIRKGVETALNSSSPPEIQAVEAATEKWLDWRSAAAEAGARVDDLTRISAVLFAERFIASSRKLEQQFAALRDALAVPDYAEVASGLEALNRDCDILHRQLNRESGGEVLPEYGTNLYGWLKNWDDVICRRRSEALEPSPFRLPGPGGIELRFREPSGEGDFTGSWTTNIYRFPDQVFHFSVLSPLMTVRSRTGALAFSSSVTLEVKKLKDGFLLRGQKGGVVIVSAVPIAGVAVEDRKIRVTLSGPGELGLRFLDAAGLSRAEETASFYRRFIEHYPVQMVQVQRGREIEQTVVWSRPGSGADFMPVAPLLREVPERQWATWRIDRSRWRKGPDGYAVIPGRTRWSYTMPERPMRRQNGVNMFDRANSPSLFREVKACGGEVVRLACGTATKWDWRNLEPARRGLQENLEKIRQAGLKAGIDMHGGWTPPGEGKVFSRPEYLEELVRRWRQIMAWCRPYEDVIAWYDLMNEPRIFFEKESVQPYWRLVADAVRRLRPGAGRIPFLIEVNNMANPGGAAFWTAPSDPAVIMGYHDYWPHMFTHQKVVEKGSSIAPGVFYPGFMPMISWTAPSWRNDARNWAYWDRWKVAAISDPVIRVMIREGVPVDCGEYGVVGYASPAAVKSGAIWLQHAEDRFRWMGVSRTVWGISGGYTWHVPAFRRVVTDAWQRR